MDHSFFKEGRGQGFCPDRMLETTFILSSGERCSRKFCLLCSAQPVGPGREAPLMQRSGGEGVVRGEVSEDHEYKGSQVWIPGPFQTYRTRTPPSQGKIPGFRKEPGLAQTGIGTPGLGGKFSGQGQALRLERRPLGDRQLGLGARGQHLFPLRCAPHFPENWPGLAFSSFRRRSRGISCRLMPWLLALRGGGRRPQGGAGGGRGQAGRRGPEAGSSPRLQIRRFGDGLVEAASAHQPVRVLGALALERHGAGGGG